MVTKELPDLLCIWKEEIENKPYLIITMDSEPTAEGQALSYNVMQTIKDFFTINKGMNPEYISMDINFPVMLTVDEYWLYLRFDQKP